MKNFINHNKLFCSLFLFFSSLAATKQIQIQLEKQKEEDSALESVVKLANKIPTKKEVFKRLDKYKNVVDRIFREKNASKTSFLRLNKKAILNDLAAGLGTELLETENESDAFYKEYFYNNRYKAFEKQISEEKIEFEPNGKKEEAIKGLSKSLQQAFATEYSEFKQNVVDPAIKFDLEQKKRASNTKKCLYDCFFGYSAIESSNPEYLLKNYQYSKAMENAGFLKKSVSFIGKFADITYNCFAAPVTLLGKSGTYLKKGYNKLIGNKLGKKVKETPLFELPIGDVVSTELILCTNSLSKLAASFYSKSILLSCVGLTTIALAKSLPALSAVGKAVAGSSAGLLGMTVAGITACSTYFATYLAGWVFTRFVGAPDSWQKTTMYWAARAVAGVLAFAVQVLIIKKFLPEVYKKLKSGFVQVSAVAGLILLGFSPYLLKNYILGFLHALAFKAWVLVAAAGVVLIISFCLNTLLFYSADKITELEKANKRWHHRIVDLYKSWKEGKKKKYVYMSIAASIVAGLGIYAGTYVLTLKTK